MTDAEINAYIDFRMECCEEDIDEMHNASSRDSYWPAIKGRGEAAERELMFLGAIKERLNRETN